jgi:TonB family protein
VARQFVLQPESPGVVPVGPLVSLLVHGAILLPFVLPRPAPAPGEGPIERLVVFLLPPEAQDAGGMPRARGIDWSAASGTGGATDAPLPPARGEALDVGRAGEPEPADSAPPGSDAPVETALTEIEVDSVVQRDPTSAAPVYPADMLARNLEGSTFVHYVVDTTGRVDTTTIRVIRSTHPSFTRAVRDALALMRFRPAIQHSRVVRQWVEQNFAFRILPRPAADSS